MYIVCIVYSVGSISNQKLKKMKTFELRSDDRTRNPHQRVGSWSSPPSRSWRGRWGDLLKKWPYITIFNSSQEMCGSGLCSVKLLCQSTRMVAFREAETDDHEGKRKVEALWPIFKIHHQKSRWSYRIVIWMSICGFAIASLQDNEHQKIVLTSSLAFRYLFDLYYRRKAISRELYDYCVKVEHRFKS